MSFIYKIFITIPIIFLLPACGGGDDPPPDTIQVSITVSNLPTQVTINKATTPDGIVEYSWGVTFDMNNDGLINAGDISLRLMHFKPPGGVEVNMNVDSLAADLWLYTSATRTESQFPIDLFVSGNTITLSVDRSALAELQGINESTMVYFQTSYHDAGRGSSVYDYHPAARTYVNIPMNGLFTDASADVGFDFIDMVEMEIFL